MKIILLMLISLPCLVFANNKCDKKIITDRLNNSPIVQSIMTSTITVENEGVGDCKLKFINLVDNLGVESDRSGFLAAYYCTQLNEALPYQRQINVTAICKDADSSNSPLIPLEVQFEYSFL